MNLAFKSSHSRTRIPILVKAYLQLPSPQGTEIPPGRVPEGWAGYTVPQFCHASRACRGAEEAEAAVRRLVARVSIAKAKDAKYKLPASLAGSPKCGFQIIIVMK